MSDRLTRSPLALHVLLFLGACGAPPAELIVDVPSALTDGTQAGWDAWLIPQPVIRTQVEQDVLGADPWRTEDTAQSWAPGMATLIASDGTEIALSPPEVPASRLVLESDDGLVAPGEYLLRVDVPGFDPHRIEGLRVGEYGQVPGFDAAVLDDGLYSLVLRDAPFRVAELPLHLRLRDVRDGGGQLTVWAEGTEEDHGALCRAWQGDAEIDDQGMVTARRDRIVSVLGLELTDLALAFGANGNGSEIAGATLDATFDVRPLDVIFAEHPTEGQLCLVVGCVPCADSGEPFCHEFQASRGLGRAENEAELLARLGGLESLDDAPACRGPDDFGDVMPFDWG